MALLRRGEFQPGMYKPRHMRNGLIFLAGVLLFFYFIYSGGHIPFQPKGGYTIKADFTTAANVQPGKTPVRVRGVEIGKVDKVERQPGGRGVTVTMRIDKDDQLRRKDIHSDARADIYWRTLLGFAFYVELDPGSAPGELQATIPESRTTTQAELDQVLASVDAPSRAGMQQFFKQFDKGFNGNSEAGRTLDELAPSFQEIGPGINALRGQKNGDLNATIEKTGNLMRVLAEREDSLGGTIDGAETTLGVTAAHAASLDSILKDAPSTLDQTTQTMVRLRGTLDTLDPVAERLRPGVRRLDEASRALRPALAQLTPVLRDAQPLLRNLRPALRALGTAGKTGVPLLNALDPTFDQLNKTVIPGLQYKSPETKLRAYEAIGPTISSVEDSASLFDQTSYTQRFEAVNGGANTISLIPCGVDTSKLPPAISCNDVKVVLGRLMGLGGQTNSKGKIVDLKLGKNPPLLKASGPRAGLRKVSTASRDSYTLAADTASGAVKTTRAQVKKTASKVSENVSTLASTLKGLL